MRTPEEISRTPVTLLTDEEIATLDADGQEFARKCKARVAREAKASRRDTGITAASASTAAKI